MMDWRKLLTTERLGDDSRSQTESHRSPFEKDQDRIVFSSAFRRLQDKTQVHPLTPTDYVRTRLTHSLEVASVGRSLGRYVGREIIARHHLEGISTSDFGAVVSAACLAHDIGNPPFGHAGEDAIRDWFVALPEVLNSLEEDQKADFRCFEGNAQGFRIVTDLAYPGRPGGLQLTMATLGVFTKYPCAAYASLGLDADNIARKKFGFFATEAEYFGQVAQALGLIETSSGAWCRHPLAFLLEAADDICYSIIDFEDGYKLGKLTFGETESGLKALMPKADLAGYVGLSDDRKISFLRAKAIGYLVDEVASIFLDNTSDIMAGRYMTPLLMHSDTYQALDNILSTSRAKVYFDHDHMADGMSPTDVLGGLLSAAWATVEGCQLWPAEEIPSPIVVIASQPTQSQKLSHLLDFISGMTDRYAVALYHQIREGVKLTELV